MLKVNDLHAFYGSIEALRGVNIEVKPGQICCIIGANGAGKTTLLKSISGMVNCTGSITFDGAELLGKSSRTITASGIVHVPEGRLVFPGLSVEENLEVGTISWHGFFGRKSYTQDIRSVFDLFPRLEERREQKAWSLSGGEQQMLAIGRGLMAHPKLLMLDEPSMGLAPLVIEDMFKRIVEINKTGLPILLIEQNAELALDISDYAYVMSQGTIVIEGPAKAVAEDPKVREAYLGQFSSDYSN